MVFMFRKRARAAAALALLALLSTCDDVEAKRQDKSQRTILRDKVITSALADPPSNQGNSAVDKDQAAQDQKPVSPEDTTCTATGDKKNATAYLAFLDDKLPLDDQAEALELTDKTLLVILNMQNDFVTGAAKMPCDDQRTAMTGGITKLIDIASEKGATIVTSLDYHSENHCSFASTQGCVDEPEAIRQEAAATAPAKDVGKAKETEQGKKASLLEDSDTSEKSKKESKKESEDSKKESKEESKKEGSEGKPERSLLDDSENLEKKESKKESGQEFEEYGADPKNGSKPKNDETQDKNDKGAKAGDEDKKTKLQAKFPAHSQFEIDGDNTKFVLSQKPPGGALEESVRQALEKAAKAVNDKKTDDKKTDAKGKVYEVFKGYNDKIESLSAFPQKDQGGSDVPNSGAILPMPLATARKGTSDECFKKWEQPSKCLPTSAMVKAESLEPETTTKFDQLVEDMQKPEALDNVIIVGLFFDYDVKATAMGMKKWFDSKKSNTEVYVFADYARPKLEGCKLERDASQHAVDAIALDDAGVKFLRMSAQVDNSFGKIIKTPIAKGDDSDGKGAAPRAAAASLLWAPLLAVLLVLAARP